MNEQLRPDQFVIEDTLTTEVDEKQFGAIRKAALEAF